MIPPRIRLNPTSEQIRQMQIDAAGNTENPVPIELRGIVVTGQAKPPTLDEFISLVKTRNLARQERFSVNIPISNPYDGRDLELLCEEAAIPGKFIQTRSLRINGLDEHRAHTASFGDEIVLQFLIDSDWTPRRVMEDWMEKAVGFVSGGYLGNVPYAGREVGFYSDYAQDITLKALIVGGFPGENYINMSPTQNDTGLNIPVNNLINQAADKTRFLPKSGLAINKLMQRGNRVVDNLLAKAKSQTVGRLNLASNPALDLFREPEVIAYRVTLFEAFPVAINVMPMSFSNPGVHRMNVTFRYKYWHSSTDVDRYQEQTIEKEKNDFRAAVERAEAEAQSR